MTETSVDYETIIPATDPPESEPEAPWGYKADGTPKMKPGRRSAGTDGTARAPRATAKAKPTPKGKADYRPGMTGIAQMFAAPLVVIGAQRKNIALQADGATILVHSPPVIEAINDLAQEDSRVAAVLEKVLSVGPYGALLGAALPFIAQVLRNHKVIPTEVATGLGAVSPEELLDSLQAA